MKEYLCVGKIIKPQGIRGEVKVQPFTDDPERFLRLNLLYLDERGQTSMEVEEVRVAGGAAYVKLKECQDRNAAEALRDRLLYVHRSDAVELPKDRYFVADLVGLLVVDELGGELGRLEDVLQAGGNDVYVVKGRRGFLFPAVKRVMLEVNLEEGRMVLDSKALAEVAVFDDED